MERRACSTNRERRLVREADVSTAFAKVAAFPIRAEALTPPEIRTWVLNADP